MFLVVPALCLLLLLLIIQKREHDWRAAVLSAAVAWGVFLTGITECLSAFRVLNLAGLLACWLLVLLSLGAFHLLNHPPAKRTAGARAAPLPPYALWSFLGIAALVALVGLTALMAAPNTWDSMHYHMVRVLYWMQNESVAHYPTYQLHQLYMSPGSAFAILHCQILSGGDRFANMPQWLSMIGSIIGVSLVAKQLGAGIHGQLLAAVVCTTIPMGILQGSSSRNDYVVSFWLVCLVHYTLRWKTEPTVSNSARAGASLGLALLAKATAYVFAPALLLLVGWKGLTAFFGTFWRQAVLAALLALTLNSGHSVRNFMLFKHPLQPAEGLGYSNANEVWTVPAVVSNVIRGVATHFIGTPFRHVNYYTAELAFTLHDVLGIDVNDPRTTFVAEQAPFVMLEPELGLHEDSAGSPLHVLLIGAALALCFSSQEVRRETVVVGYGLTLLLGFVLSCGYLKWTSGGTCRFHLTLFVLWAPVIGVALAKVLRPGALAVLSAVLLLTSLPYVFCNSGRALVGADSIIGAQRRDLYFRNHPSMTGFLAQLQECYAGAAEYLRAGGHTEIGMIVDDYEYPFWMLVPEVSSAACRFEHIYVEWPFGTIPNSDGFRPSAIVYIETRNLSGALEYEWVDWLVFRGRTYICSWSSGAVKVFVPFRDLVSMRRHGPS